MESILEVSPRTTRKILIRLGLLESGCFNCGWNLDICDLHHIREQAKGGAHTHDNLVYLCPNCHRLAHKGKLPPVKSFAEVVGERWKQFYNIKPRTGAPRKFTGKRMPGASSAEILAYARMRKTEVAAARAKEVIQLLEKSNIDRTRYGWKQEASKILNIAPQKVTWYLKKYAPHLLDGAKKRAAAFSIREK
jgi:hypothetical protein